jgi:hypothetical protein
LYNAPALVLLLSPSLRQSQELFRKLMEFYRAVDDAVPSEAESALRIELANGSRVVSLPGKDATIRGYSGVTLLIIDEASRVPDALYQAVRPMLAVSGGRLLLLSTPFGKRGFFYEAWQSDAEWQRVKITAQCPRISRAFLAEERATIGEWWYRQEYLCEFMETEDSVFRYEDVQAALASDAEPLWG